MGSAFTPDSTDFEDWSVIAVSAADRSVFLRIKGERDWRVCDAVTLRNLSVTLAALADEASPVDPEPVAA